MIRSPPERNACRFSRKNSRKSRFIRFRRFAKRTARFEITAPNRMRAFSGDWPGGRLNQRMVKPSIRVLRPCRITVRISVDRTSLSCLENVFPILVSHAGRIMEKLVGKYGTCAFKPVSIACAPYAGVFEAPCVRWLTSSDSEIRVCGCAYVLMVDKFSMSWPQL